MAKNMIITVNPTSKKAKPSRLVLGTVGENLQDNLIVDFDGDFIDGACWFECDINGVKSCVAMEKQSNRTYQMPIKSCLLAKAGTFNYQIRITLGTVEDSVPVFKSEMFQLTVLDSINAVDEIQDDYPELIDTVVGMMSNKADKVDLETKADKSDLENKADKTDLETKADKADLETKADLENEKQIIKASGVEVLNDLIANGGIDFKRLKNNAKQTMLDFFYPVETIYQTRNVNFDPNTAWGGTWERLPNGYVLQSASTGAGEIISAGLPNITGKFEIRSAKGATTATLAGGDGAMSIKNEGSSTTWSNSLEIVSEAKNLSVVNFDASKSNSIYGNSNTVQPNAIKVCIWVRVA